MTQVAKDAGRSRESQRPAPPPVWRWYVAFCVAWALFYGFAIAFTLWAVAQGPPAAPSESLEWIGLEVWLGLCAVLLLVYAAAPLLPRRPWTWTFGIVIIAFSALGGCFFVAIPLLVFWVRPDLRAYLGRAPRAAAGAGEDEGEGEGEGEARLRRLRRWYAALMVVTALLYLTVGGFGALSLIDPELAGDRFEDVAMAVVGFGLFPVFVAGALLPRRRWAWACGAGFIIAATTTCCTLPLAVPLLVAWFDPRTRSGFGAG